ncbi:hypothetical protein [Actinoplanes sp. URMC 104]|uniref:hypothetical protein n=1 Tax=Actinoplanes sp. URMC 104 TaxID=3423409 RepID=UPI003F1D2DB2
MGAPRNHDEVEVTVTAVRPYGLDVVTGDGHRGCVDLLKISPGGAAPWPREGDVLHVVVLDETRFRASLLPADFAIARRLRPA